MTRPARRSAGAATLMEALVALGPALALIAGLVGLVSLSNRASAGGELGPALEEGARALSRIRLDLMSALERPDRAGRRVDVEPDRIRLERGDLGPDGSVRSTPVEYRLVPSTRGALRIERREGSRTALLPGSYRRAVFHSPSGPGSRFVRILLVARPAGASEAILTTLVDLPSGDPHRGREG